MPYRLIHKDDEIARIESIRDNFATASTGFELFQALKELIKFYGFSYFLVRALPSDEKPTFKESVLLTNYPQEIIEHVADIEAASGPGFKDWTEQIRQPEFIRLSEFNDLPIDDVRRNAFAEHDFNVFAVFPVHVPDIFDGVFVMAGEREPLTTIEFMEIGYFLSFATIALRSVTSTGAQKNNPLSEREIEILAFLAAGETPQEIAERLSITPNTISYHLRKCMISLGARTKAHAVTIALRNRWI